MEPEGSGASGGPKEREMRKRTDTDGGQQRRENNVVGGWYTFLAQVNCARANGARWIIFSTILNSPTHPRRRQRKARL